MFSNKERVWKRLKKSKPSWINLIKRLSQIIKPFIIG